MSNDSQHFDEWTEAAASDTYTPLSPERLAAMFLWTSQHGPPNCWTGTAGAAATMIRELLRERIRLVEELETFRELRDDAEERRMR
jgi:hypothetical protein